MTASLRLRDEADVAQLGDILARQQPTSGYPHRWPLPFPVRDFIVRPDQEQCWVAEVDGGLVGHVAIGPPSGEEATAFLEATGRDDASELALVAVLFVDVEVKGQGIGGLLIAEAVDWARSQGRLPVLDVLAGPAVAVYLHLDWQPIGELRPGWLPEGAPPMVLMQLPEPRSGLD